LGYVRIARHFPGLEWYHIQARYNYLRRHKRVGPGISISMTLDVRERLSDAASAQNVWAGGQSLGINDAGGETKKCRREWVQWTEEDDKKLLRLRNESKLSFMRMVQHFPKLEWFHLQARHRALSKKGYATLELYSSSRPSGEQRAKPALAQSDHSISKSNEAPEIEEERATTTPTTSAAAAAVDAQPRHESTLVQSQQRQQAPCLGDRSQPDMATEAQSSSSLPDLTTDSDHRRTPPGNLPGCSMAVRKPHKEAGRSTTTPEPEPAPHATGRTSPKTFSRPSDPPTPRAPNEHDRPSTLGTRRTPGEAAPPTSKAQVSPANKSLEAGVVRFQKRTEGTPEAPTERDPPIALGTGRTPGDVAPPTPKAQVSPANRSSEAGMVGFQKSTGGTPRAPNEHDRPIASGTGRTPDDVALPTSKAQVSLADKSSEAGMVRLQKSTEPPDEAPRPRDAREGERARRHTPALSRSSSSAEIADSADSSEDELSAPALPSSGLNPSQMRGLKPRRR
jgi:hypothetical protein